MANQTRQLRVNDYAGLSAALEGAGPLEIRLEPGEYYIEQPIRLGQGHANVTLRGAEGVRFIGGKRLRSWHKVADPAVRSRFDPAVRDFIYELDLASQGIGDYGRFVSRGFVRDMKPSHAELFLDGKPLNLSQYPRKGGFLPITGIGKSRVNECEDEVGIEEYGFGYDDDRPSSWAPTDDLWVHGYWCWDWANSCEHVKSIDLKTRHILTHPPYAVTSFLRGQRFYFFNILEEVRYPGDYYIDRVAGKLYFYPAEISGESELLISMLEEPILEVNGADNVTLDNIGFECSRGIGLSVSNTTGFTLDSCEFKHIGNCGVKVSTSWDFTLKNSDIHDTGDGGFLITGGDRMTLRPCDGRLYNNHIYRIAQWSRCYCTAINASAVGLSITHNLIHDCPHIGILWAGNDLRIEDNEIYSVCMETGDAGAIYAGRDLTFQGNRICHNFIHHLGGRGLGTMGIYNDDGLSNTVMEDNFFIEVGRACFMGGGRHFECNNNVFVKCYPAINVDARIVHTDFFWGRAYDTLKKVFYDARQDFDKPNDPAVKLDAGKSPYVDKYPSLKEYDEMFKSNKPMRPCAHISRNVICSAWQFRYFYDLHDQNKPVMYKDGLRIEPTPEELSIILDSRHDILMEWSAGKGSWFFEQNYSARPEDFADVKWGNITVKPDSKAVEYGHTPRDFSSIGLVYGERRRNPPLLRTALTRDVTTGTITLEIRNDGNCAAGGTVRLYPGKDDSTVDLDAVPFTLAPGETASAVVGRIDPNRAILIEARSDLAGLRPSRVR
ncbi:MAG: right-handed parallel beta-helix repeat-containing protein [Treponema sp.]|jgi:hypothetical protein|nr:right-handed parallel beta-helix repeat-containing protein [Treponema sp.]